MASRPFAQFQRYAELSAYGSNINGVCSLYLGLYLHGIVITCQRLISSNPFLPLYSCQRPPPRTHHDTMHYIRFLKPPRISPKDGSIISKITITTDLGESFLALDIGIVADIRNQNNTSIYTTKTQYCFTWRGSTAARALEIVLPRPTHVRKDQILQMVVRPEDERYGCESFASVLEDANLVESGDEENEWGEKGRVVAVRSMPIDLSGKSTLHMDMAERVFYCGGDEIGKDAVHIWEETGESIARHIWYSLPF